MTYNSEWVQCPRCGNVMIELDEDFSNMSEGQQANYDAGFGHPYLCQGCDYYGNFDVNVPDVDDDIDDDIDYDSFEIEEDEEFIPITVEDDWKNSTIIGTIIKEMIGIEIKIDEIILKRYIKEELKKEFSQDILQKEFFSLEQKIKILKNILGLCGKEIIKTIRFSQSIRNAVAHTKGMFDSREKSYAVTYTENRNKKEIYLNQEFIQKFQHECYIIKEELDKIINQNIVKI